eukprot:7257037-Prymnesium_polylepis.1
MIAQSDAVAHPRAVVVEALEAAVAVAAVAGPRRPPQEAGAAPAVGDGLPVKGDRPRGGIPRRPRVAALGVVRKLDCGRRDRPGI